MQILPHPLAKFSTFRIKTPRKEGGLGPIQIPLMSDLTHQMSKDYGVYLEDAGHTLRFAYIMSYNLHNLVVSYSRNVTIMLIFQ